MFNFLSHTEEVRQEMLNDIGLDSVDDLFSYINKEIRVKNNLERIPEGLTELEAKKKLEKLAGKNLDSGKCASFLGGGVYNRYIPACIDNIIKRSEFFTAYTPYQPEVSQGTLQVIYEYQSMICNLTGMDVANASVYDGATAAAEAILMSARITNRNKAIIASALNPDYKKVIETYCDSIEIEYLPIIETKTDIEALKAKINDDCACVLIQNPNYLGTIEDVFAVEDICKNSKSKFIVCADPVSLALLKSPLDYGADIVVGDIQPLGVGMVYGGPHGGFIACKTPYLRQLPGRIVGMSLDRDGERAFTLTLQAREQHIRRAKATSNICSNQALVALAATVYMSVVGPQGLKEIATVSTQRAHFLADNIDNISGFKVVNSDFLYEFTVKLDRCISIDQLLKDLEAKNILGGINLSTKFSDLNNCLLICTTEMNERDQIDKFIDSLIEISAKYFNSKCALN